MKSLIKKILQEDLSVGTDGGLNNDSENFKEELGKLLYGDEYNEEGCNEEFKKAIIIQMNNLKASILHKLKSKKGRELTENENMIFEGEFDEMVREVLKNMGKGRF